MSISIIVADDHQVMREGLRLLIDDQPDMEVVAEAKDGRQIVELVREHRPDIVLMDIGMPHLNGIEATRQIRETYPQTRVLALSMHSDKRMVSGMLAAGACGYLLKDCDFSEIAQAIRVVAAQRTYLSPRVADVVVEDYIQRVSGDQPSAFTILTPREREVLQLLAEGGATKTIASQLHISVKTVETHRRQIMEKLNLFTVADLTKYAIREGLTSLKS